MFFLSLILSLGLLTLYLYKHQQIYLSLFYHRPEKHYIVSYLYVIYLTFLLKVMIGVPSIRHWVKTTTVQGNIFSPTFSFSLVTHGINDLTIQHLLFFILIGLFVCLLWEQYRHVKMIMKFAIIFSTLLEVLQLFTRFNDTDVTRLLVHVVGILLGWLLYLVTKRLTQKYVKPIFLYSWNKLLAIEPKVYVGIALLSAFLF